MTDFEQARIKAFEQLQETNSVSVLDVIEKKKNELSKYPDVWSVQTEILMPGDEISQIKIFVCLPSDFPLILPRLYLNAEDYNRIKYIPHIDVEKFICLFDDETISLDTERPGDIIHSCLIQARKIIEAGLHKKNTDDFKDEFIAYWAQKYDTNDSIETGLDMITGEILPGTNTIQYLFLKRPYTLFSFVLHNENKDFKRFRNYLKDQGIPFEEMEAFYLGDLDEISPPYNALNSDISTIVKEYFPALVKDFERFINFIAYPKLVLFSMKVKERILYFGWRIFRLELKRNGYRTGTLSGINVFNTFQKSDPTGRLKFQTYTKERLALRTDGVSASTQGTKIGIAGLGSIGSNLLHYLLSIDLDELQLIDPEVLSIENTNRHLLGMEFIGVDKVESLKTFLLRDNPLLRIVCHKKSIITLVREKIGLLNDMDFVFIAIGKNNIEEYIYSALREGTLKTPVFFLWVEPYLCGGHCLYINPGHDLNINELYKEGLFKYNIIDESEYVDTSRQLLFREAGCQASYAPYGKINITLFLSRLFPIINKIITGKESQNKRITWKGNKAICEKLNLKLSGWCENLEFDEISINDF